MGIERHRIFQPTQVVLRTSEGTLRHLPFSDFDDDPIKGRAKAHEAAIREKDNWLRNAPQYLAADQQITIVEE